MKFPNLVDILKTAAVTSDAARGLTREQHRAQEELRSRFDLGPSAPAHGLVLPWYAGDANREARDMTASGQTSTAGDQGGMTIATEVPEIGTAFRENLVLEKLGARILGGFRGDVKLPRAAVDMSAEWKTENAAAADTDETLAELALEPHRVTASMPVSDQLLRQGSGIEAFLRLEMLSKLAVEIQRVAIAGVTASDEPTGIINTAGIGSVVGGTNGAAPTYANLCDLEFAVTGTAKADRGNLGWLVSPDVRRTLRKTPLFASGSVPIWSETAATSLLGHAAGVTPSVPDTLTKGSASGTCSAIVFGEFSELFVVLWGSGIIFTAVRDKADAIAGKTQLYATAYVDTGVRNPAAFAAMLDAICT